MITKKSALPLPEHYFPFPALFFLIALIIKQSHNIFTCLVFIISLPHWTKFLQIRTFCLLCSMLYLQYL
jgi:hypothetical protein